MGRGHVPSSKGKPHNFASPFNIRNGSNLGGCWPALAMKKAMATHSSVLAWRIPEMEEPGGLPSMGSHRVRHDWSDLAAAAAAAANNPGLIYIPFKGFTEEIENMELTQKYHNDINLSFCYDSLKCLIDPDFNGSIWEEGWESFSEGYARIICCHLNCKSVESPLPSSVVRMPSQFRLDFWFRWAIALVC